MRKLLRKIARYNMKLAGIQHPNKRPLGINPETRMIERMPSFFSQNWRSYATGK